MLFCHAQSVWKLDCFNASVKNIRHFDAQQCNFIVLARDKGHVVVAMVPVK